MGRNEGVEDGVVEDADARLVVGEVVVGGLVIVEELHGAAACDDAFGGSGDRHAVDFIQRAVKSLHSRERPDIPDPKHTRNISRYDLISPLHPPDSNQRVIMPRQFKDPLGHVRVPNEHVMVATRTQNKVIIRVPV